MNNFFSILLIFCLGILTYSNTFHCSFHFDDFSFIVDNFAIRNIHHLQDIWKFYPCRFVTFLSLAFNYHFSGLDVFGYHLFNLAVHLLSACFIWWLTRMTLSTPVMKDSTCGGAGNQISPHADLIALFAGLVFVSHPVQTEAVTYIWQRAASMTALFYLASLCFYVKSRLLPANESKFYYIISLVTAVVAMFTKENAITLPLMILLYELTFLRTKGGMNWRQLTPFLLTLFVIPFTTVLTNSENVHYIKGSVDVHQDISPLQYALTQLRVMVTYIRLTFLPLKQNLDYDYPISKSIFELPALTSFLFLAGILFFAKRFFQKYRLVSFSIFWFFLTSLPESSPFPLKDVIFEHRLYLPLAGYSMLLASGAYYLLGRSSIKTMVIVLTMIIAFNSILTYQRNKVWRDEISLWGDAVRQSPHKARAFNNLGGAYLKEEKYAQAIRDFDKAIAIDPNYGFAYRDRGVSYLQEGNIIQAISDLDKAIKIDPDNTLAYWVRATIYYNLKEYDKAWSDVHKIEQIGTPADVERTQTLVKALSRGGRF